MEKGAPKLTQLETGIVLLIDTFNRYAKEDGQASSLSKSEAKKLLEKELPQFCTGAKNQDEVNKLIKDLDIDGSGEIDIMEFMVLVASLACCFHGAVCKQK